MICSVVSGHLAMMSLSADARIVAFGHGGMRQMKVQLDVLLPELQSHAHRLVIAYFCLAVLSWKYWVKIHRMFELLRSASPASSPLWQQLALSQRSSFICCTPVIWIPASRERGPRAVFGPVLA